MYYISPFSIFVNYFSIASICMLAVLAISVSYLLLTDNGDFIYQNIVPKWMQIIFKYFIITVIGFMILVFTELYDKANHPVSKMRTEIHRVEITQIFKPTHFHISFIDKSNGQVFDRLYISKHCPKWQQTNVGDEMNMTFDIYQGYDGKQYNIPINLYFTFCS